MAASPPMAAGPPTDSRDFEESRLKKMAVGRGGPIMRRGRGRGYGDGRPDGRCQDIDEGPPSRIPSSSSRDTCPSRIPSSSSRDPGTYTGDVRLAGRLRAVGGDPGGGCDEPDLGLEDERMNPDYTRAMEHAAMLERPSALAPIPSVGRGCCAEWAVAKKCSRA